VQRGDAVHECADEDVYQDARGEAGKQVERCGERGCVLNLLEAGVGQLVADGVLGGEWTY